MPGLNSNQRSAGLGPPPTNSDRYAVTNDTGAVGKWKNRNQFSKASLFSGDRPVQSLGAITASLMAATKRPSGSSVHSENLSQNSLVHNQRLYTTRRLKLS